ncbi:SDR family NAD(P)-dependent oxidoreductase [Streptomyces sp. DG2A-72]|nr:SDR family NAD(P)-dependent oxidoreductase [Streptomyces sp. DG2A-72]MDO0930598.1 SDR family NAD(P)-dependent oxidoreductase [Streptomyces sp. DG2A-72]
MGTAVARRLGSGRIVFLAEASRGQLGRAVDALRAEGYEVEGMVVDVCDRASVHRLAEAVADAGRLTAVVHTAGLSAATASARTILEVNMVGTAHVLDAFEQLAVRGTAMVCVSSMAGHYASLSEEQESVLATAPAEELLALDFLTAVGDDGIKAYILSKRANHVRVEAAALAWSRRGARVMRTCSSCWRPAARAGPGHPRRSPPRWPASPARTRCTSTAPTCSSTAVRPRGSADTA